MKKYLFLLFLFVIYLIIIIKPKTSNVFLSNEMNKNGVSSYTINFDLGINTLIWENPDPGVMVGSSAQSLFSIK